MPARCRPIVVDKQGEPVGGIAELTYRKGDRIHFKVKVPFEEEIHLHGYDVMKEVPKGGGTVTYDLPAEIEGVFEAELEGRKRTDRGAQGRTVSFIPFAHALAARQDLPIPAWLFAWAASIVLIVSFFALSAAWREPKFEDEHARPLGRAALRASCSACRCRSSAARSASSSSASPIYAGLEGHRSARPQLRPHLPLRHLLARLPLLLGDLRRHLPALQPLAGDRPRRRRRLPRDRRPAPRAPRLPRAARPLAGRDRPARRRLARGRLRRQRRRRGRPRPARRAPSPPSSTASTRWR